MRTTFVHSVDPIFPSAANEVTKEIREEGDEKTLLSQQLYHEYLYKSCKTKW